MEKPRYDLLDGLRGVAAVMVLLYHVFNDAKAFYVWPTPVYEFFHGFLGVDFFFILSGFVMGYAYDERLAPFLSSEGEDELSKASPRGGLEGALTIGSFIKRRLIRLHPMVVMGALLGLVAFLIQGCTKYDGTQVGIEAVLWATLLALFLIPSPASMDVRGNTEIFPLNGPHWSLFFEYIGSLLYGLFLHRLPTKWLRVWVGCTIVSVAAFALLNEDGGIAFGWSSQPVSILGGSIRLLYAYPMGLLMARMYRKRNPKPVHGHVFLLSSLAIAVMMGMPSLGSKDANSIYQLICLFSLFPAIIWYAARGSVSGWRKHGVSFLGRLSYPLYASHYPLIYLYIIWIGRDGHPYEGYSHPWFLSIAVLVAAVLLATLCLLFYDEPLRKLLSRRSK